MSPYKAQFEDRDGWEASAQGVRSRRWRNGSAELRLAEIPSTAVHPEWCVIGHSGCVIEGTLEIEFERETVRFQAGDGIVIPPGSAHRHRPRAITTTVKLALVDHLG